MQDYMRALRQRFETTAPGHDELTAAIDQTLQELRYDLDRPKRKLLLRLVDLEDALRDVAALNSFMSGYRLACGIHKELSEQPPYSFDREEEERTIESFNAQEV